jgi:paraquat-inducible protein B
VEFKGIKVGSVIDIRLEYDSRESSFRIPVLIEIEPERVIEKGEAPMVSPYQTLQTLVDRGLRAQLQSGSLLTGQLFIELDMHPGTPLEVVGDREGIPELPTIPSNLEQMATSVKSILADLETVDMERIGSELLETLQAANRFASGADDLVRRPELRQSVEDLQAAISSFRSILQKVDRQVEPVTANLGEAIGSGHQALVRAQETMKLIDDVLQPGSPLQYRFFELSEELAETARSIRALVDLLERNPNSLIFGKNPPGGP